MALTNQRQNNMADEVVSFMLYLKVVNINHVSNAIVRMIKHKMQAAPLSRPTIA